MTIIVAKPFWRLYSAFIVLKLKKQLLVLKQSLTAIVWFVTSFLYRFWLTLFGILFIRVFREFATRNQHSSHFVFYWQRALAMAIVGERFLQCAVIPLVVTSFYFTFLASLQLPAIDEYFEADWLADGVVISWPSSFAFVSLRLAVGVKLIGLSWSIIATIALISWNVTVSASLDFVDFFASVAGVSVSARVNANSVISINLLKICDLITVELVYHYYCH